LTGRFPDGRVGTHCPTLTRLLYAANGRHPNVGVNMGRGGRSMTFSGREPSRVDGTTGAVRVMEALCASSRPLSVREIEERAFVPKSTVHRILLSLEKQQWVYRESGTGGY